MGDAHAQAVRDVNELLNGLVTGETDGTFDRYLEALTRLEDARSPTAEEVAQMLFTCIVVTLGYRLPPDRVQAIVRIQTNAMFALFERSTGVAAGPQATPARVISPEDFEHYRKAAGLIIQQPIPPLSDDLRRAAYEQVVAICDSHEALRALAMPQALTEGETQPPIQPRTDYAGKPVIGSWFLAELDDTEPGTRVRVIAVPTGQEDET
jgi:hypothetical protein